MAIDYVQLARQAAARRKFVSEVLTTPNSRTKREVSSGELERVYRQYGYHAVFCFHDVLYILPCKRCKRDAKQANANLKTLIRKCS